MFLTDLHTHSCLSMDGHVPLAEMARAALSAGVNVLCVTDHCDLLDENGVRHLDYDWPPALEQFAKTEPQFQDQVELRLGIELGEAFVSPEHAQAILAGAGERLDFVIGSIHNYSESLGGGDFFFDHFGSPEKCYAALDDYFTNMAGLTEHDECWDVLGHIIYPLRYMVDRDGQPVTLEPYRDRLEAILRRVIERGKGIEVNTCRGRSVRQWKEILAQYKSLGGELITVGSDAHQPGDVGRGIAEACELIQSAGFPYITVYRGRKPFPIKF